MSERGESKLVHLSRSPVTALLQRMARSPVSALMPDVLSATISIGASTGAEPMGLIVAFMSGFAGVYAPSSARRVEHALTAFAEELAAIDPELRDHHELRDEEFLHLLRDLIVHSGRITTEGERARLRRVLLHGVRTRQPAARTRLFFDLAAKLSGADVGWLASLERQHQASSSQALTHASEDVTSFAVLEREGLIAQGAITALGAQFLRWAE